MVSTSVYKIKIKIFKYIKKKERLGVKEPPFWSLVHCLLTLGR